MENKIEEEIIYFRKNDVDVMVNILDNISVTGINNVRLLSNLSAIMLNNQLQKSEENTIENVTKKEQLASNKANRSCSNC